jgi:hypothetical protein
MDPWRNQDQLYPDVVTVREVPDGNSKFRPTLTFMSGIRYAWMKIHGTEVICEA